MMHLHTPHLSCLYENGHLREIRAGGEQLVAVVYGAVRDESWGTIPCQVVQEAIQQHGDGFTVSCVVRFGQHESIFEATYTIEGRSDDSISFEMKGVSNQRFNSNRIGICIHLPADECCSLPVTVTGNDGNETPTEFPATISPHQPFSSIRGIHWKTACGHAVHLQFEGDIFEAEDQRNWMDNSYKIYSRPLHLPFPFTVEKGDTMQQRWALRFSKQTGAQPAIKHKRSTEGYVPVPAIGLAAATGTALLTAAETDLLNCLPLRQYRAEVDFETDWKKTLNIHLANAESLSTCIELILFFSDNYLTEATAFAAFIHHRQSLVKSLLPLHKKHKATPAFLQQYFYPFSKQQWPQVKTGYGTDAYFAELNRHRPENELFDFVIFSINPQVHVTDTPTLLDNIGSIPYMMETIRSFTGKPVYVSPVTLKKRKNHDAADNPHAPVDHTDDRLHTAFGAGWFLRCLYALHGAAQVSFFTTTGSSGLINNLHEPSPLYEVLQSLRAFSPVLMKLSGGDSFVFKNERNDELVLPA
ncbi:MAG: hypothetical protein QM664_08230 [Flavihumibacter sp.]